MILLFKLSYLNSNYAQTSLVILTLLRTTQPWSIFSYHMPQVQVWRDTQYP